MYLPLLLKMINEFFLTKNIMASPLSCALLTLFFQPLMGSQLGAFHP